MRRPPLGGATSIREGEDKSPSVKVKVRPNQARQGEYQTS